MPTEEPKKVHVYLNTGDESTVEQSHRDQTDVNLIVKTYQRTGQAPQMAWRQPQFGDFSIAVALEDAFNMVREAREAFETLPSAVRALAGNSPTTLLEMLADEGAMAALVKVGLQVTEKKPEEPEGGQNPTPQEAGGPPF